jgi:hypothetical protein
LAPDFAPDVAAPRAVLVDALLVADRLPDALVVAPRAALFVAPRPDVFDAPLAEVFDAPFAAPFDAPFDADFAAPRVALLVALVVLRGMWPRRRTWAGGGARAAR